ncbi:MAG: metal ABC transporter ATP-binding protein [Roseburia inulinivorans]
MAQITCKNLEIGYDGKAILDQVSFSVNAGDYMCIIGENGSGKSTLMRTLLHLQQPVSGSILLGDGIERYEIGYLPQQTVIQKDFPASVREIVLSGCQNHPGFHPFYSKAEKELANEMIAKMQISSLTDKCYRELSGGQQQRVLLARALCATQKILLLDEPVSGLDPNVTTEMYHLIEHLNQEEHITIIMISHDIKTALSYASHVLHIGTNIFYGTKQEYFQMEALND